MASATVGASTITYGVTNESYGYFEDLSWSETSEVLEAADGDGDIVGAAFHGNKTEFTGTYIHLLSVSSPDINVGNGTAITLSDSDVSGKPFYISNATTNKTNGSFKSVTFTGTYWPNLAV